MPRGFYADYARCVADSFSLVWAGGLHSHGVQQEAPWGRPVPGPHVWGCMYMPSIDVIVKLPIYNPRYTHTVFTVIAEVDEYFRPKIAGIIWARANEEEPVPENAYILVDHQSGSAKHKYYQRLLLIYTCRGCKDKDEELGIETINAKIIAAMRHNYDDIKKIIRKMKIDGIPTADGKNEYWTQVKLLLLDWATEGKVSEALLNKEQKELELAKRTILETAKKLPINALEEVIEELKRIIEEKKAKEVEPRLA